MSTYQERLFAMVYRMTGNTTDTDDLLQEIFIKAWVNLDQFRERSRLYTWLYRIGVNETLNHLARQRRETARQALIPVAESAAGAGLPVAGIEKIFSRALARLPEKQRLVFNLRYFDEMSYQEMSEVLQTSVGALKASFHHALKKLEKDLVHLPID